MKILHTCIPRHIAQGDLMIMQLCAGQHCGPQPGCQDAARSQTSQPQGAEPSAIPCFAAACLSTNSHRGPTQDASKGGCVPAGRHDGDRGQAGTDSLLLSRLSTCAWQHLQQQPGLSCRDDWAAMRLIGANADAAGLIRALADCAVGWLCSWTSASDRQSCGRTTTRSRR